LIGIEYRKKTTLGTMLAPLAAITAKIASKITHTLLQYFCRISPAPILFVALLQMDFASAESDELVC
jgi:hypothetical protein